jgi:hypothetical protein
LCTSTFYGTLDTTFVEKRTCVLAGLPGLAQGNALGAFPGGGRLPSTRDLAEQLDVSRTVVLLAYDQLLAEGFGGWPTLARH